MPGTITALKPTRRDPTRLTVFIEGEAAAVVPSELIHELDLAVGRVVDEQAEARLDEADRVARAVNAAMRALARRPFSRRELRMRLARKGHAHDAIVEALSRADRAGLLDDEAYAREAVRCELARKPAGRRLIESKLRAKGIDAALASRVASEALVGRDPLDDAVALIRRYAGDTRTDPVALRRRLAARLARRGFDPETCRTAVQRVLGEPDIP